MRKSILYSALLSGGILLLYTLMKKEKTGFISPGEGAPIADGVYIPKIELIPVYPRENEYVFHAFVRQEIEVKVKNLSTLPVTLNIKCLFEVPGTGYFYESTEEVNLPQQYEKSVIFKVDFPWVLPWEIKEAHVTIIAYDSLGRELNRVSWKFYIKGLPL